MPSDEKGRYFMSDENIPRRYYYTVEQWVAMGRHPERKYVIDETDLPSVDFMVVKIEPEDAPMDVTYQTVFGPMNDWDFVEGILSYDYGDEGSRIYPMQGVSAA